MDMNKSINEMTDEELQEEVTLLSLLKESLIRCMQVPSFQDNGSEGLLHDTECSLVAAKCEWKKRKLDFYSKLSILENPNIDHQ